MTKLPLLLIPLLLLSSLFTLSMSPAVEEMVTDGVDTPLPSESRTLVGREQSVNINTQAAGDFLNLTQDASLEGQDNQSVLDLWTGDPDGAILEVLGNETDWMLEVWINNSLSDRDLFIRALSYDGDQLVPTPDFALCSDVHNASVYAAEIISPMSWTIFVAGTRDTGGGSYAGFYYLLGWNGGTDWDVWESDLEYLHDGNETVFTDLKIDHVDSDDFQEIVLCGWVMNETHWDGLVIVFNISAVAGPLNLEHYLSWSHLTSEVKPQALEIGRLNGAEDLAVAGLEQSTSNTYGRFDLFSGLQYPWPEVTYTTYFGDPFPSSAHDVAISDVDQDGVQELVMVGEMYGQKLIAVGNWTLTAVNSECYDVEQPSGADYSVYYEVEVLNRSSRATQEVFLFGKSHMTATSDDRGLLDVRRVSGTVTALQTVDLNSYDRITNYCELRLTGAVSDSPDLVLGWSREDKYTQQRNDTVFDAVYSPYPTYPPASEQEESGGKDRSGYRYVQPTGVSEEESTRESTWEYWLRLANENGWYIASSIVVGVVIWFLALKLGLLGVLASWRDPRAWGIGALLVFLTIFQWPGIPVYEFWLSPRGWTWYRVTWLYDYTAWAIGSVLP